MLEIVPNAKRILIFYQRGYPIVPSQLDVLRPAAKAAGILLIEEPAESANDIQIILRKKIKANDINIDAILMISEPLIVNTDGFIVLAKFAAEHKIPIGGSLAIEGNYESIFGVSTNHATVGKQAAILADKIFKGTPAGKIMVVSAESYLQINYRAAQKLGLKINENLLNIANEIIQ
jgi:putative ABC transport system substrate-binding protein